MEKNDDVNSLDSSEVLKLVKEVKSELKEYRKQFESSWNDYDNAYYGKQHKTGEDRKTVKNHIFKIIEGEVPILTDSFAATSVLANRLDRQDDADALNNAINYVYQDQNLPLLLPSVVRSSLISAPGYLYVSFNPDAEDGQGKIEFKQINWKHVFLDGNTQTIEQAEKGRIELPMRRNAVARKWPEKKEEILKVQGKKTEGVDDGNFEARDISHGREINEIGKPKDFGAKDVAMYAETWVKDYSLKEIEAEETQEQLKEEYAQIAKGEAPDIGKWENHPEHEKFHMEQKAELLAKLGLPPEMSADDASSAIDQLAQQNPEAAQQFSDMLLSIKIIENHLEEHKDLKQLNPEGKEPKFEDGWRVIKTYGDVVLYDGANPLEDGHIPLVPFYGYKDETIYGFGEVKNILDPQRTLNTMDDFELRGLKVCSNPGWIADHESEIDSDQLTNEPGVVIQKKGGTEVRRLEPGQVSPQLNQRKQSDQMAMEDISGINEATQGQTPASASGAAISKLQTQAIGRVRLKDRYLQHYSIRRLGLITASFIIKNWTAEKHFRLRNDITDIREYVFNPIHVQDLEYSIDIAPGSMAGIDKDALNAAWMNLYNMSQGAMTFTDLLKVVDIPKREVILQIITEREQQAQQQQAQQQDMQAQMEQLTQQMQQLSDENVKLKGAIDVELLNKQQKGQFDELRRQDLTNQITGNMEQMAPNQGQA